ncbi:hypothetical protein V7968_20385 [Nocardia vulneris]|uniref:hypothetical protein n=1 Tax=Nocardia vulneris TaxID=1141657 RepID=UPI0030D51A20
MINVDLHMWGGGFHGFETCCPHTDIARAATDTRTEFVVETTNGISTRGGRIPEGAEDISISNRQAVLSIDMMNFTRLDPYLIQPEQARRPAAASTQDTPLLRHHE